MKLFAALWRTSAPLPTVSPIRCVVRSSMRPRGARSKEMARRCVAARGGVWGAPSCACSPPGRSGWRPMPETSARKHGRPSACRSGPATARQCAEGSPDVSPPPARAGSGR
eukprot:8503316-Pyramimonas_sp.AAC.1